MAINATFEDLANPHFGENMNAYMKLKRTGMFSEEELQELFWKQMELDKMEIKNNK